jgi:hypothetical protein
MVTSKKVQEIIANIIKKHHLRLVIGFLGNKELSLVELALLEASGYDTSNKDSLLSLVYNHVFATHNGDGTGPQSIGEMKVHQSVPGIKPVGDAHDFAIEGLNDSAKACIEKLRVDTVTRIQNMVRDNNNDFRMDSLLNMDRPDALDQVVRQSSVGKLRQKLRDASGDGNRDWTRIATTEISNAIGLASADRIVTDNIKKDLEEVYVYRIAVNDAATCKWCKRFYIDEDGSPAVYKLSTLMANGSNMGKQRDAWQPTVMSTHPSERCSQILELKPGFALSGNKPTYIGTDKWNSYIVNKVRA